MSTPQKQGILLIEETLKELESPKGSIASAIKKLSRAGILLNENDVVIWCDIQLGKTEYTSVIQNFIDKFFENNKLKTKESGKALAESQNKFNDLKLKSGRHIFDEELTAKSTEAGGGYADIGFIEEKYNDLVRRKKGNDDTYYKTNLLNTLSVIQTIAHRYATEIYKNHAFKELAESNFEVLKRNVEDVLFELNPELAEKMLLAFKAVSSDNPEEWSHALTTCRRFFEQLADTLFPPVEEKLNGRALSKGNYINRLWAFMDMSIESETNKEIAKAHVDFLGAYLQTLYKVSNKGVHAGLTRLEALKSVMHIYLMCADILKYLDKKSFTKGKLNIHTATLDELESIGNVTRAIAKEIIRIRVSNNVLTADVLNKIPKLGAKSLKCLQDNFNFEPLSK